ELERRGRPVEATSVLFAALAAFPKDVDVRQKLGRFRGPARGPWGAPNADARNTRLSTARGPRGQGKLTHTETFARVEDAGLAEESMESIAAPLLAAGGPPYASLTS